MLHLSSLSPPPWWSAIVEWRAWSSGVEEVSFCKVKRGTQEREMKVLNVGRVVTPNKYLPNVGKKVENNWATFLLRFVDFWIWLSKISSFWNQNYYGKCKWERNVLGHINFFAFVFSFCVQGSTWMHFFPTKYCTPFHSFTDTREDNCKKIRKKLIKGKALGSKKHKNRFVSL